MESKKKKEKFSGDLSLFTTTLVAMLLVVFHDYAGRGEFSQEFLGSSSSSEGTKSINPNRAYPLEIINKGLKAIHDERSFNQDKVELEKLRAPQDLNQAEAMGMNQVRQEGQDWGTQLQPENPAIEIAKRNRRPVVVDLDRLDTEVARNLATREELREYDEVYRKEYIKQFLENARKDGYVIILNDDLSIKEVKNISPDGR
tara:strand:+ start:40903 stop:41505 length:603 start_codon:yes stop_codon:yes gene_type:complete